MMVLLTLCLEFIQPRQSIIGNDLQCFINQLFITRWIISRYVDIFLMKVRSTVFVVAKPDCRKGPYTVGFGRECDATLRVGYIFTHIAGRCKTSIDSPVGNLLRLEGICPTKERFGNPSKDTNNSVIFHGFQASSWTSF